MRIFLKVPLKIESLNKSDVFILDDNKTVFQWNGPGANRTEKLKVNFRLSILKLS